MSASKYQTLIKNAKVFNNDESPVIQDVAINNGKIVERGNQLNVEAEQIIDATGLWLMPGMFDIHTHYDLELEVAPGLPESVRHGTTSVVIANCSLGLAYGAQRIGETDPIVDCYARVENIPKRVLRTVADKVVWNDSGEYLEHLDQLNLGPNIVTMVPHSMLRIEAMGFEPSISRDPTESEMSKMKGLLKTALDQGYAGFSTDALPFHYLANQPNCHKTIPTQFAKYGEIKQLTDVVREADATWQATPPKDSPWNTIKTFLLTSGRIHGKPLRTTVVAALDVASNRNLVKLAKTLAKILNTKFLNGQFYMQALGAPFKVWADGATTPLAEEIPELRRLNEVDLEDRETRAKIMQDPEYIAAFKKMWLKGKQGFNLDRLKRKLRLEEYAFDRDMNEMVIDLCPQQNWQGKTFLEVFERVKKIQKQKSFNDVEDQERDLVIEQFSHVEDEADFMLQMLRSFDIDLSWYTVSANRDMKKVRELLMDPSLLPGFNDSGAHLSNMAFYDVNLRSLKLAAEGGDSDVAYMVKRLTKDAADVFGVQGGTINIGDVADLILIDPKALSNYDGEGSVQRIYRDEYSANQLVNRSDGVVPMVMIAGDIAWQHNDFTEVFGTKKLGRVMKPNKATQAA